MTGGPGGIGRATPLAFAAAVARVVAADSDGSDSTGRAETYLARPAEREREIAGAGR